MPVRRGQSHPAAKLTDEQVINIRKLWKMGHRNIKTMARNHKISPANVTKIVKFKSWQHLTNEFWNSGSL